MNNARPQLQPDPTKSTFTSDAARPPLGLQPVDIVSGPQEPFSESVDDLAKPVAGGSDDPADSDHLYTRVTSDSNSDIAILLRHLLFRFANKCCAISESNLLLWASKRPTVEFVALSKLFAYTCSKQLA